MGTGQVLKDLNAAHCCMAMTVNGSQGSFKSPINAVLGVAGVDVLHELASLSYIDLTWKSPIPSPPAGEIWPVPDFF